jgi:hypothetical protein
MVSVLGVLSVLALGVMSPPAQALSERGKVALTKENVHLLQIAVQDYWVDHDGLYPRFTTAREFRALLRPYLFTGLWPTNPYTNRPVRLKRNAGNLSYATYGKCTKYRLVGWGRHGRRIMVVP